MEVAMKRMFVGSGAVMAAMILTAAVSAQTPSTPPQTPSPSTSGAAMNQSGQRVTLIGCIQRESDYRQARDQGKGGVVGTGVGVGDEFVLTNASASTQGLKSEAAPADTAYELTGSNESKAKDFVGKRVEVTGTLKPAAMAAAGTPTGGATAGKPPTGVDVASKDLKLRELEVMSIAASTTGTCQPNK